ncbi:hypothetical protein CC1G_09638 [Coprinopsis cinerea okayama7|uniref:Ubiquitin-like domain-containing protein n=1 Tax=Coprinopsis cinerea (strain Okayama-7 / 130 / ATCC MYA-4618 / FGSC 9003) TaxID=240176 RepID=A8P9B6_COPC7|nr:hypothetical protein CC1G_09638 [Coprinopsis cinerea okayama7\|eukprot:XP_001839735.1 hypothetical protein CC1G_09638 [Coprinopsis cinerea okayama7\
MENNESNSGNVPAGEQPSEQPSSMSQQPPRTHGHSLPSATETTLVGSQAIPAASDQQTEDTNANSLTPPSSSQTPQPTTLVPPPPIPMSTPSPSTPEAGATPSSLEDSSSSQPPPPVPLPQTSNEAIPQTPQVYLTFLLISGHRRTMSFDPSIAVGRVKELVWNGWPGDWPSEERPPAPSYLRILYLGKMLQDDETLSGLKLPTHTPASSSGQEDKAVGTIMHISIRPFGPGSEVDGTMKKKPKRRGTRDRWRGYGRQSGVLRVYYLLRRS